MNKNLKKITVDKLKFLHQCNYLKPEAKELTAFEKFKLTPAYKLI